MITTSFVKASVATVVLIADTSISTEVEMNSLQYRQQQDFCFCDGALEQVSDDHVSLSAFVVKIPPLQSLGTSPTELVIDPYMK